MNGPDQILPAENLYTTSISGSVRIRQMEIEEIPPRSWPVLFDEACTAFRMKVAMNYKEEGKWVEITYQEYWVMVRNCAKSFIYLGLKPQTVVCILGYNSPEWFISTAATIYAGGVAAGIYLTNSPEACLYCINHSKARFVVVEGPYLGKILQIRSRATELQAIILYGSNVQIPDVIMWDRFVKFGEKVEDSILITALQSIAINQCCTIVYTSGTTGDPKAAMLSHDNIVYSCTKMKEKLNISKDATEVYVSYLPLSHVAGNVIDIHLTCICGFKVYFADRDALKGSLLKTLKDVKPTRLLTVPRVWEKVYEKLQERTAEMYGLKRSVASWAMRQGLKKNLAAERNESTPFSYYLARSIFLNRVKSLLGIENCKTIVCGAAPLSLEVKLYLASMDVLILEGYGLTESSALHTSCTPDRFRFDSCGTTHKGIFSLVENPDSDGNGELCIYGRHVFMGYLDDEERTAEAIDKDGYLHTGDIVKIDRCGFAYITGRLKELIITAGGENVSPVIIEMNLHTAMPYIGYAVVIGDKRKFLSVLLTLKAELNDKLEPTDVLAPNSQSWLSSLGFKYTTMKEVLASGPDAKILEAIQSGIDEANAKAISNPQKIQKFVLLPRDFSIATGEIGPTYKLKRQVVAEKFKTIIDNLYN